MCGRYALHANPHVVALQFGLGMIPGFKARYNITPGTDILIVREDHQKGLLADLYRWGLIPGWAKDPTIGNKLADARGETVAEKPSFRNAFKRWRCLVPASGFYEWKVRIVILNAIFHQTGIHPRDGRSILPTGEPSTA